MNQEVTEFSCKEECDDDPIELRKYFRVIYNLVSQMSKFRCSY